MPTEYPVAGPSHYPFSSFLKTLKDIPTNDIPNRLQDLFSKVFNSRVCATATRLSLLKDLRIAYQSDDNTSVAYDTLIRATEQDGGIMWCRGSHVQQMCILLETANQRCPRDSDILEIAEDCCRRVEESYKLLEKNVRLSQCLPRFLCVLTNCFWYSYLLMSKL